MRAVGLAAGLLGLLVAFPASGQQPLTIQNAQTLIKGSSRPLRMQVVDTSKALAPLRKASSFRSPRPPATFTLSRVFPKITAGPWPPRLPRLLSLFQAPKTPAPINPQSAFRLPQK